MNSMLDIQGAFIIGGILMLNLLGLNLTISNEHAELSSDHISQSNADELMAVVCNDFRKIGYHVVGQDPIQKFDSTRIVFLSDLNNDGVIEKVEYSLSETKDVLQTSNPRDRYLYRTIGSIPKRGIALGVVDFKLIGFNASGQITTVLESLAMFEIIIEVEATDPIGNSDSRSVRRARISPVALNSN